MQELDRTLIARSRDLHQMIYWCDRSETYTWGVGGSKRVEELRAELRSIVAKAKACGWDVSEELAEICKS